MTTSQSASLAVHGEVKRGSCYMEPKAPQTCGAEAPTARSGFFTFTRFLAALALAYPFTMYSAQAQTAASWPDQTVTLMVPYAPGGGTDMIARLVGAKLSEVWGQSVIVENKSGANGAIGSADVARAKPDGTKIMLVVGSHIINPVLTKSMPFDTNRDFTPITRLAVSPLVLVVRADSRFTDIDTFMSIATQETVSVGYSEGQTRLTGELLRQEGVNMTAVPYRGGSLLMTDIIGGHVDSGFTSVLTVLPHVKAGTLRVIGVAADQPVSSFSDAKTFAQAGYPQVESLSWYGLFGPRGMPDSIVQAIIQGLRQATEDAGVRQQLNSQGAQIMLDSPQEFQTFLTHEYQKWSRVAQASGIAAQ